MDGLFHLTATMTNQKAQTDKIQLKKSWPQSFTKQAETCVRTRAEVFVRFWNPLTVLSKRELPGKC